MMKPNLASALPVALILSGCVTAQSFTHHDMPKPGDYNVCLRVTLTYTYDEAGRRCSDAMALHGKIGCAEYPKADGSPMRLIAPAPKDWNDWQTMALLGHELVHNLGGKHE